VVSVERFSNECHKTNNSPIYKITQLQSQTIGGQYKMQTEHCMQTEGKMQTSDRLQTL